MADDRGDPRVSSFLIGFLVGSLVAGGAGTGFCVWQEYRLTQEAERVKAEVAYPRAVATLQRHLVEVERKSAEAEPDRAELLRNAAEVFRKIAEQEGDPADEALKDHKEN